MRTVVLRFVCACALFIAAANASAAPMQVSVLYDRLSIAVEPLLSNTSVLFEDFSQGAYRFMVLNVTTRAVTEVRNNLTAYLHPFDYSGTHAVWIGYNTAGFGGGGGIPIGGGGIPDPGSGGIPLPGSGGAYAVKSLRISDKTETRLSLDSAYKAFIAADGPLAVWTDYRHFAAGDTTIEIYLYDHSVSAERRITDQQSYKAHPHVRGNSVVWQDYRNAGTNRMNADIYLYDLSTRQERAICTHAAYQDQPCVHGNLVVWQDYRNAGGDPKNADIYLFDLSTGTEKPICTAPGYQAFPKIFGNFVVWHDYRNTESDSMNADIYGYDLSKDAEFAVTTKGGFQAEPSFYGSLAVWLDYGDRKLYSATVGAGNSVLIPVQTVSSGAPRAIGSINALGRSLCPECTRTQQVLLGMEGSAKTWSRHTVLAPQPLGR